MPKLGSPEKDHGGCPYSDPPKKYVGPSRRKIAEKKDRRKKSEQNPPKIRRSGTGTPTGHARQAPPFRHPCRHAGDGRSLSSAPAEECLRKPARARAARTA